MNWDVWWFQCIRKDACCREYLQHSESSANVLKLCFILESWFLHLFHLSVLSVYVHTSHFIPSSILHETCNIHIFLVGFSSFFFTYINKFLCDDQISIITMDIWDYINIRLFLFFFPDPLWDLLLLKSQKGVFCSHHLCSFCEKYLQFLLQNVYVSINILEHLSVNFIRNSKRRFIRWQNTRLLSNLKDSACLIFSECIYFVFCKAICCQCYFEWLHAEAFGDRTYAILIIL